ncbi:DNA-formamidopyrimidine glycosylase [Pectinatus haikarae]|uniref:Formamidopyrimidine-DNA glycosylase n=1 Tax=Pectinatus haikarae TaxID=349096 RepID=A0ABT9Y661_9FIRM|nr:DNA-formamidopyrimidine glycosylase [Pectinatus haikarae]MDQ0203302.1 formamidopyrimidine-DNA glycosylase [Pectinatus haikarae]
MPEMPEVETIRRTLEKRILGKTIEYIEILLPRLIKFPELSLYEKRLTGQKIVKMRREGKYLIMQMENNIMAVFHLRMTGRLCYVKKGYEEDKYKKIIFYLDNGDKVIYADMRTFGTLYAIREEEREKIKGLYELGCEPLSKDFTVSYLVSRLKKNSGKIKMFLLNQKNIAGLGNIYVDEALFLAGINPEKISSFVNENEAELLCASINKVISEGIRDGGTTFRDYVNGEGRKGTHQDNLFVYGRDKKPCKKCGTIIEKIKVGGRGTCFCPECQKLEK